MDIDLRYYELCDIREGDTAVEEERHERIVLFDATLQPNDSYLSKLFLDVFNVSPIGSRTDELLTNY